MAIDGGLIKKILDMFYIIKYASVTEIAKILLFLRKTIKSNVINGKKLKLISSIPKKNSAFCLKTSYFMNK